VAARWAEKGQINYGKSKAIFSILHDDTLGKHGRQRAMQFADGAESSYPSWGGSGAFCSEFVVACYQAAAISIEGTERGLQGALLECDAKHCSVRALHDRLLRDSGLFTDMGLKNYQYS
jgi:hypothetical protein